MGCDTMPWLAGRHGSCQEMTRIAEACLHVSRGQILIHEHVELCECSRCR